MSNNYTYCVIYTCSGIVESVELYSEKYLAEKAFGKLWRELFADHGEPDCSDSFFKNEDYEDIYKYADFKDESILLYSRKPHTATEEFMEQKKALDELKKKEGELRKNVINTLKDQLEKDYNRVTDEFIDTVVETVKEDSDFLNNGHWNTDDILLAIKSVVFTRVFDDAS